jgi:signal transduction histidine kinase
MKRYLSPLMNYLSGFWHCLIAVGVGESLPEEESKYVRFTNVVAVLTALAVVFYIPFTLYKGYYALGGLQAVDALFVLLALWLNYRQHHTAARHVYMAVINFFVLMNACFIGFESKVHDFFYISYVVPFLLFSVKDYKNIVAGVLMAIVSFFIYQNIYPLFTAFNLDMATQLSMYQINIWMKFVLFGAAIYILAFYNYTTERELAASNKRLNEQSAELKRSNEDLEQFAYIISHDLKAPVRNISSFMKILLTRYRDSFSKEAGEFIDHARISSDRLAQQIDDLLAYCKTGRNLPPVAAVDLSELVKTLEMELGGKLAQRNAHIICERKLPVIVDVHATMIYHVFQNLVENAIKFNTGENPEVRINYKEEENGLLFTVSDNGIGIPAEYQGKLFQMFKRLHTSEQFEGTGIGLALCKKIVNFYKGNIWLESEPGKGTTFYFTLHTTAVHSITPFGNEILKAA